jgi:hypothetical protein
MKVEYLVQLCFPRRVINVLIFSRRVINMLIYLPSKEAFWICSCIVTYHFNTSYFKRCFYNINTPNLIWQIRKVSLLNQNNKMIVILNKSNVLTVHFRYIPFVIMYCPFLYLCMVYVYFSLLILSTHFQQPHITFAIW